MHCYALLATYVFIATALGAAVGNDKTTSSKTSCLTQMGAKSTKRIPTSWTSSTQNLPAVTVTKTTQSTVKVTPAAKTITVTKYATVRTTTTLKTLTEAFTTTLTETGTITNTDTVTTTTTSSQIQSTTVTETVTAPTPAGFRPASDTAGEPRPVRQIAPRGGKGSGIKKNDDYCEVNKFPQSVQCKVILQIRKISTTTITRPAATITLPQAISLVTKTATITKTDEIPIFKVSSTATQTSSTTITAIALTTTTVSTTTTSTSTATAYTTLYPLCSGGNLLSNYNGQKVSGGSPDPDGTTGSVISVSSARTPETCCAACFDTSVRADCQGFLFGTSCFLVYPPAAQAGTCAAHGSKFATGGFFQYTVGNGPCGTFHAN